MFCPNCGKELEDGLHFCTKCGTPLDVVQNEDTYIDLNINEFDMPNQESYHPQNENMYDMPNQESYYPQNENMYDMPNQESYYPQNENMYDMPNQESYYTQNENMYDGPNQDSYYPQDDYYDESYYSDYQGMERPRKRFNKLFLVPIIGVPVVAILLCLFFFTNIFGGGAKAAAENYIDALAERDAYALIESSIPNDYKEYLIEKECDGDESKLEGKAEEQIDNVADNLARYDFNLDGSYSLEMVDKFSESEIDEMNREYHEEGMHMDCTEGVFFRVEQDGAESFYIPVVKIDGTWYAAGITDEAGMRDDDYD